MSRWRICRIAARFGATLEFEGAIESLDAIHFAVRELAGQVAGQLAARGLGARELRLTFRQPYAAPVEKLVRLMRPCRNESALMKLISCAMENLEASEGFVAASLNDHQGRAAGRRAGGADRRRGRTRRRRAGSSGRAAARAAGSWWRGVGRIARIQSARKRQPMPETPPARWMLPGARGRGRSSSPAAALRQPRSDQSPSFGHRRAAMANLSRSPITAKSIGWTTSAGRSESPANGGTGGGRPATTSMCWIPPATGIGSSASHRPGAGFCMGYSSDARRRICMPEAPNPKHRPVVPPPTSAARHVVLALCGTGRDDQLFVSARRLASR